MENFKELHQELFKLFLTDHDIAECLDQFPSEISIDFIEFVQEEYNKRFNVYYRYLTKVDKTILKKKALLGVLKDWENKKWQL